MTVEIKRNRVKVCVLWVDRTGLTKNFEYGAQGKGILKNNN